MRKDFALLKSRKLKSQGMTTPELQADSRRYFALVYDYVPNILERRGPYRPEHLALCQALESEGKLVLAGPWGDPVDGGLLLWHVHSADEVQQFVDKDPYAKNGLVTKFDIRPVNAVAGTWVTAAKK